MAHGLTATVWSAVTRLTVVQRPKPTRKLASTLKFMVLAPQEIISKLPRHIKVVDLSADFRLKDINTYAEWCAAQGACWF